jgi:hypothetical protein
MDSSTRAALHAAPKSQAFQMIFSWLVVGIPLLWGVLQTLKKAAALFR